MSDTNWKKMERRVAKMYGTRRVPLSGSRSGHDTSSDSLHDKLYIECRYRKKIAVINWLKDVIEKAARENKIPVIALKTPSCKYDCFLIRSTDLFKLADMRAKAKEEEETG